MPVPANFTAHRQGMNRLYSFPYLWGNGENAEFIPDKTNNSLITIKHKIDYIYYEMPQVQCYVQRFSTGAFVVKTGMSVCKQSYVHTENKIEKILQWKSGQRCRKEECSERFLVKQFAVPKACDLCTWKSHLTSRNGPVLDIYATGVRQNNRFYDESNPRISVKKARHPEPEWRIWSDVHIKESRICADPPNSICSDCVESSGFLWSVLLDSATESGAIFISRPAVVVVWVAADLGLPLLHNLVWAWMTVRTRRWKAPWKSFLFLMFDLHVRWALEIERPMSASFQSHSKKNFHQKLKCLTL